MITITSIHLFKVNYASSSSWKNTVQDIIRELIKIEGCDSDKKKELEREIDLAEQGCIEKDNKYIHDDNAGYSLSFGQLMAVVTNNNVKLYYSAPNGTDGWEDKKNAAFLLEKTPQLFKLADSGLIDLIVIDNQLYGSPDWVYVFLKKTSAFYGFDSLIDIYERLKADEILRKLKSEGCVEVKNTFFSRREFISMMNKNIRHL